MASIQAEVRELIDHIRKAGYKVAKTGNGSHHKVLTMAGAVVRDANGPLIISGSPGDHRWREMHVKRLMGAGVLKADPFKPTGQQGEANGTETNGNGNGNGRGGGLHSEAAKQRKAEALAARSERFKEETAVLRARFEPVVVKLGGWSQSRGGGTGLSTKELGEVVFSWAKNRGRVELPKTTSHGVNPGTPIAAFHVVAQAGRIRRAGETMGQVWLPLFTIFIDELFRGTGDPPDTQKAADRYMELLREAKGIAPVTTGPKPGEPVPQAPQAAPVVYLGPAYQATAPTLALRAMFLMARHPDANESDAMAVATEIADLELTHQAERRTPDAGDGDQSEEASPG